jgi:hypothetical protein
MKIRTSIEVKFVDYPEYDGDVKQGIEMLFPDYALDMINNEQYILDLTNSYRCSLADATYKLTKELIHVLQMIHEKGETE